MLSTPQSILAVVASSIAIAGLSTLVIKIPSAKVVVNVEHKDEHKDIARIPKGDLEVAPVRVIPTTKQITESIKVADASPPTQPVEEPPPPPPRFHKEHRYVGDICTAHGLHKVFSHNGKSWRCR